MESGEYGSGVSNVSSHGRSRATFEKVKCHTDWLKWQEAIKVELATLKVAV
jgi:hypothetical protein